MWMTLLTAGKQIRNVAAVGGNIMTGSPISDLNPIFLAAGCRLRIGSVAGDREISFDENFFTGYRIVLCSAPSVAQPVVQSRRRPLLGPSPG